MEESGYLCVIGVGSRENWEAGRGSFYYVEDRNGEKALPVFTTPERVESFTHANFDTPKAHMEMLESIGLSQAPDLTAGRFVVMSFDNAGIAEVAATVEADYLIRDPRPGTEQEILRFTWWEDAWTTNRGR
jgi:hypothetical protein